MVVKRLIYAVFVAFLASAATIVILSRITPRPETDVTENNRAIAAPELARHDRATDCWMAIEGGVYDLTAYIPVHPAPPDALVAWCGKEATGAFATKGYGSPHSAGARAMLPRYRVGRLAAE